MAYIAGVKIVRTSRYAKDLKRLGASADEIGVLEEGISTNPLAGDIIVGLHGVRKIRFGLGGKGKRGGGRAIYFVMVARDVVIMIAAYSKSRQSDLTSDQRRQILELVQELTDGQA